MSIYKKLKYRKLRRAMRVRRKFNSDRPRVSVFKSLNHIYAQIINDADSTTLVDASSLVVKNTGDKTAIAHAVGVELAKRALGKGVTTVAFDRGSFLYHGRVKALADGLREGGLQF